MCGRARICYIFSVVALGDHHVDACVGAALLLKRHFTASPPVKYHFLVSVPMSRVRHLAPDCHPPSPDRPPSMFVKDIDIPAMLFVIFTPDPSLLNPPLSRQTHRRLFPSTGNHLETFASMFSVSMATGTAGGVLASLASRRPPTSTLTQSSLHPLQLSPAP